MEYIIKNKEIDKKEYKGKTLEDALYKFVNSILHNRGLELDIIDIGIINDRIKTNDGDNAVLKAWRNALLEGAKKRQVCITHMRGFVYGDDIVVWDNADVSDMYNALTQYGFNIRTEWTTDDVRNAISNVERYTVFGAEVYIIDFKNLVGRIFLYLGENGWTDKKIQDLTDELNERENIVRIC